MNLRSSCFMGIIKINVKVDVVILKKVFQGVVSFRA